mmetsp:Transcript_100408/g.290007  ORF Transcript_100408/g.290007 Transcript_100408/m.290007 type:complete len:280 (-) Transcript_100408:1997-2836(-)
MPTPTCASWIIGTSLAPSPMASVTGVGFTVVRTSRTICAFCEGETRQAITTQQSMASFRNSASLPTAETSSSAWPVTSSATDLPSRAASAAFGSRSCCTRSSTAWLSPGEASRTRMYISLLRTRVLKPMFLAVSSLSPVRTHSLMPAARTLSMVSSTPTWSLSSIAVTPTTSRSRSMVSATAASASSRLSMTTCAFAYSSRNLSNSSFGNRRLPNSSVRRPCSANAVRWPGTEPSTLAARSSITLSAPFTSSTSSPDGLLTMTDWRFLAEVNALRAKTV